MNNVIEISHLNKCFGEVKAVQELSFCVKEGELFAFLGVNGAGKSTTINMLCGQLEKDSGTIVVCGKEQTGNSNAVKKEIGVVFQTSVLDQFLTVKDNLFNRAALYGIRGQALEKRLAELDDLLGFRDLMKRTVGKLSGGQKRKIDIVRALLHEPKILVLDEPTTGLDPQTRKTLWDAIERMRAEKGMTVFLTTHYMEETADADYVVILDGGQIVAEGTPHDLKNKYTGDFITLYGVAEEAVARLQLPYQPVKGGISHCGKGYGRGGGIGREKQKPVLRFRNNQRQNGRCIFGRDRQNTAGRRKLMYMLSAMIKRNIKLYFKNKGMFFTSLITPVILLVLYVTFLRNVYESSFVGSFASVGIAVPDKLIDGCVAAELCSSLLAVSAVTVAFCSNFIMVHDKVTGVKRDFSVSPIKRSTLALGYYIATLVSTLIVCYCAAALCLGYMAISGWYMSVGDVFVMLADVFLIVMFGCALSSIINVFLKSEGQISAVGTIVSAGYGFVCGAYMPISSFSAGLQNAMMFLPGTYGTSMIRNSMLRGVIAEMGNIGFPPEALDEIKKGIDCNLYFFDKPVSIGAMYAVMGITIVVLIGVYILITGLRKKRG